MAENTGHLRHLTVRRYENGLAHAYACFGRTPISEIDENEVARLVSRMRKAGKAGWTIRATLTPVSRVMQHAVRRGWAAANPVAKLEKGERSKVGKREMRVLERDEIARLLDVTTASWRPLFALLVFTGRGSRRRSPSPGRTSTSTPDSCGSATSSTARPAGSSRRRRRRQSAT
jgi:integrase